MPCCYRRATVEEAATIGSATSGVPAGDVSVRLHDVSKHFGSFVAVDEVSLDVRRGEFFSLLGPSGSGTGADGRSAAREPATLTATAGSQPI